MHVMAVLLFDDVSFKNCVTTGTILNDKGEKLSKSKMNYTDPWKIMGEYGVDALRYYLMTSVVMQAENLYFNDREVRDVYNKVINILSNVLSFNEMYSGQYDGKTKAVDSEHVLDKWILSKINLLVEDVTKHMDAYNTVQAGRPIKDFIDDLSTWYLRRSRDRFKGSSFAKATADKDNEEDKQFAIATLQEVLLILSKVMAPFTPFIAEKIYLEVGGEEESVHLETWPQVGEVNHTVLEDMIKVRKLVEMGLALRVENGLKVRQVLGQFLLVDKSISEGLKKIIADEMNVKVVELVDSVPNDDGFVRKEDGVFTVGLDITLTDELKKEGLLREVVRTINQMRKEQKLTIEDVVKVEYSTDDELLQSVFTDFEEELKKSVLAVELNGNPSAGAQDKEIDGKEIKLSVIK